MQGAIVRGDLNSITVAVQNGKKNTKTQKTEKNINKNRDEAYQIFIFFWATKDYTLTGMGTIASTCLYNTAKTASNFGHYRT